jgi:hypothetical protein
MTVKCSRTNFPGIFVRCSRLRQRALRKHIPVGIRLPYNELLGSDAQRGCISNPSWKRSGNPQYRGAAPPGRAYRFAAKEHFFIHLTRTRALKGVLPLKVQKDGSDRKDFLFGEFRIDRKSETAVAQLFSDREIARFVTEMRVGLL